MTLTIEDIKALMKTLTNKEHELIQEIINNNPLHFLKEDYHVSLRFVEYEEVRNLLNKEGFDLLEIIKRDEIFSGILFSNGKITSSEFIPRYVEDIARYTIEDTNHIFARVGRIVNGLSNKKPEILVDNFVKYLVSDS